MNHRVHVAFSLFGLFFISLTVCARTIILSSDHLLSEQLRSDVLQYIVREPIDLHGETISFPANTTIVFQKNGVIANGHINGENLYLRGKVKLFCRVSGSLSNKELPISAFDSGSPFDLEKRISDIFNLNSNVFLLLDKDINLSGSTLEVKKVLLKSRSKNRINNPCSYRGPCLIDINNVIFDDFQSYKELFFNLSEVNQNIQLSLNGVVFNGCNKVDRFFYLPLSNYSGKANISATKCDFFNINNYVIQCAIASTGVITECRFDSIGNNMPQKNVCVIQLGENDGLRASDFLISRNHFTNIQTTFSDIDDSREAHALLVYGHRNTISHNIIRNIYVYDKSDGDPGKDAEGIYIKGGNNIIKHNYLYNCIGTGPDGAITVKTDYTGNQVIGNQIYHRFGNGIQCYTPNSLISNNTIESAYKAESAITLLANSKTTITNNKISLVEDYSKLYHAAFIFIKSSDIFCGHNNLLNCSSTLCTYTCSGNITFSSNNIIISNKRYGVDTYYTAPFSLHDDVSHYFVHNNVIKFHGIKSSQVIEASDSFKGNVTLVDNTITIEDSPEIESSLLYIFRNVFDRKVSTLVIKKIRKISL